MYACGSTELLPAGAERAHAVHALLRIASRLPDQPAQAVLHDIALWSKADERCVVP